MNNSSAAFSAPATSEVILWVLAAMVLYALTRSPTLDDWDSVQFALGTREFNLFEHQPHPPGYPLYVFAARLIDRWTPLDTTQSLIIPSILGGGVFIGAWFWLLARSWGLAIARPLAAALMFMPMIWMNAIKALSDIPAAAALAVEAALVGEWLARRRGKSLLASGFVGAIGAGLRPQNILAQIIILAQSLERTPSRAWCAWRRAMLIFSLACLAWLIPTMISQQNLAASGGNMWAYPHLLFNQWEWRLDKPDVYIGAGDASPAYFITRIYRHTAKVWVLLGMGWSPRSVLGFAGCALLLIGAVAYLDRKPWRSAADAPFWRRHLPWAVVYFLMIFLTLPPDARYYAPIAPLLLLAPVAGLARLPGRLRWAAWSVPLLLAITTAPLARAAHRKPAPPVLMLRGLQQLVPAAEREHTLLLLEGSRRHANWYTPEFKLGSFDLDPDVNPMVTTATRIYTDAPHFLETMHWKGWRMIEVMSIHRSPIIHPKHADVYLYQLTRESKP